MKIKTNKNNYAELASKSEYWYAIEEWVRADIAIKHQCKTCGIIEEIKPKNVLHNRKGKGTNCKVCAKIKYLKEEHKNYLIELANIDIVPLEPIKGRDSKSLHKCTCGNKWGVKPYDVLRGIKCYECSGGFHTDRFYLGKETILYYIKIGNLWKIGVTLYRGDIDKSLKRRFGVEEYEIVFSKLYKNGAEAYYREQEILESNVDSKYNGEKTINYGFTEVFSEDISKNILSVFSL